MAQNIDYRYRISQEELNRLYQTSKWRKEEHPDIAEKYRAVLSDCIYYESENEALGVALKKVKNGNLRCQIWAEYMKEGDVFRIRNRWLVSDDWRVIQAADYLGLALMFDSTMLQKIVGEHIEVDDIVAYY